MSRRLPSWWPVVAIPVVIGIIVALWTTNPAGPLHHHRLSKPLPQEYTFNADHGWKDGVALPSVMDNLPGWQRATGEHPAIIGVYTNLAAPLPVQQIKVIITDGAMPLVQINPKGETLSAVLAGVYDRQLRADAAAITALKRPVAISFAHEMNGRWTAWGCHHNRPAVYRAAFRYVHKLMKAPRLTWVWNPSRQGNGACPASEWYPGGAFVNWVGLDGYLRTTQSSFDSAFSRTIATLRRAAPGKPMFFAESGVPVSAAMVPVVRNLYAGARRAGMFGLVWFDGRTYLGDYHPDADPAFLATFRRLVSR